MEFPVGVFMSRGRVGGARPAGRSARTHRRGRTLQPGSRSVDTHRCAVPVEPHGRSRVLSAGGTLMDRVLGSGRIEPAATAPESPGTAALYAAVFAADPDPSALIRPDLTIWDVNAAFCRASGQDRADLL